MHPATLPSPARAASCRTRRVPALGALLTVVAVACGAGDDGTPPPGRDAQRAAGAGGAQTATADARASVPVAEPRALPVDSYLPPEEALRRFRQGVPEVARLTGGARSRDALVRRFVRAVETRDTAEINRLIVSRAEFAWLYYPHTPFVSGVYALDPQTVWFQLRTQSETGIARLFDRLGGAPLGYRQHDCPAPPLRQGLNRVWEGCVVRRRRSAANGGGETAQRLFGAIVERGGEYKFVGYGNAL